MANIDTELTALMNAVYGEEVRSAFRDALLKMNNDVIGLITREDLYQMTQEEFTALKTSLINQINTAAATARETIPEDYSDLSDKASKLYTASHAPIVWECGDLHVTGDDRGEEYATSYDARTNFIPVSVGANTTTGFNYNSIASIIDAHPVDGYKVGYTIYWYDENKNCQAVDTSQRNEKRTSGYHAEVYNSGGYAYARITAMIFDLTNNELVSCADTSSNVYVFLRKSFSALTALSKLWDELGAVTTDLDEKITDVKADLSDYTAWYRVEPEITEGYFLTDRGVPQASPAYAYTEEFVTNKYDQFTFIVETDTAITQWVKLCVYDYTTGTFLTRIDLINSPSVEKRAVAVWNNPYTTRRLLLRVTFKKAEKLTIIQIPSSKLLEETQQTLIIGTYKQNQEQTVVSGFNENKIVRSGTGSIGSVIDTTLTDQTGMNCTSVNCSGGDIFTITGIGSTDARLWAFLDADNIVLARASTSAFENNLVITAPDTATKLIVNVNANYFYAVYKGSGQDYIQAGTRLTSKGYNQHYIQTNVATGSAVNLTPQVFYGYECAVVECSAGDVFTISGKGGGSGRLWAFIDNSNNMLSKSPENATAVMDVIIAPDKAKKLIVNSVAGNLVCYKGHYNNLSNDTLAGLIQQPEIHDLDKAIVSMPTVRFSEYIQQETGVSGAKPAIFKNGNHFCVTYGENIDGTGTDIPLFSESGCLVMKYKEFDLINGVESNVRYGTFAQKGSNYTDYSGNTATMSGGTGLPSGVNNLQYFTTPYYKEDADASYNFSGISKYGMTPCCCTVTVTANGVQFGTIKELTLSVSGTVGKFDMHRIDKDFYNSLTYLTTCAPYYDSNGYKWLQPVTYGFAYLTSSNGVDWTYQFTVNVPYQPMYEVACIYKNSSIYFAARTRTRTEFTTDALYVGKISNAGNKLLQYKLLYVETRPCLVKSGNDILLFYTPANKAITECIRICEYASAEWYFWRWFTVYKNGAWYITCYAPSVEAETIDTMYLAGGNGEIGSTTGMTFLELTFDTSKPYTPGGIPAMVL